MPDSPRQNIHTALDYLATTYGADMTYWEHTNEHPAQLPVHEREAWHRDAWDREQTELSAVIREGRARTEERVFGANMERDV